MFLASSANLYAPSLLQVCYKFATPDLQSTTRQYLKKNHAIFIEKYCFTVFSSRFENPVLSLWKYHLPFLSNIETQVTILHCEYQSG